MSTNSDGNDPNVEAHPYTMTLSLNVLNHLGINLYSNVPAVLSEVVANAWDADATNVSVLINSSVGEIRVADDGHGMLPDDINKKFLQVGYNRRAEPGGAVTQRFHREVMGRKGIGKLSLFSISEEIEIHTVRNGTKSGFKLIVADIRRAIAVSPNEPYHPLPVPVTEIAIEQGTLIILRKLKKRIHQAEKNLRKRLARRFSVLGASYNFSVSINEVPVNISDREYFHKLQFVWWYGNAKGAYDSLCTHATQHEERRNLVGLDGFSVDGWIGTVEEPSSLKEEEENLNRIVVMVRGKLAQEDILADFTESGIYSKYLMGEIGADFLDLDNRDDIATTSRQKVIEDDERYLALRTFLRSELKHIHRHWDELRNSEGEKRALENPAIKEWFLSLSPDSRRSAKALFGKINQLTIEDESDRRLLFKHGVLAFETLRYKENLDALERLSPDNIQALAEVIGQLDDIEATLYLQIVKERVSVIDALRKQVEADAREKVLQKHLFDHLWLLDPSWERATATEYMEQGVAKEFGKIDAKLTDDEKAGRVDIKYRTTSGKHIIIELKRADRQLTTEELMHQASKYRNGLRKLLNAVGKNREPIEVVCVVGKELTDWAEEDGRQESEQALAVKDIRVVMYQELIENSHKAYKAFLDAHRTAGKILELLNKIEAV